MDQKSLAKFCRVCGAKAICFHYNGLSCYPCRIFYKRNISRIEELKCGRNGNCANEMDQFSRKSCSKCRLLRCIEIGMDQTKSRKYKRKFYKNNNQLKILIKGESFKLPTINNICPTKELNLYEAYQIEASSRANSIFPDENKLEIIGSVLDPKIGINLPQLYIKIIIKYCKQIPEFKSLPQPYQMAILKTYFCDLIYVRMSFYFDKEKDAFLNLVYNDGIKVVQMPKRIFLKLKSKHLAIEGQVYTQELQDAMENDSKLKDLVSALILFKKCNDFPNYETLRYQHSKYANLIGRYFVSKYNNFEIANEKFCKLMKVLDRSDHIRNITATLMKEIGVNNCPDIIVELFNLNQ